MSSVIAPLIPLFFIIFILAAAANWLKTNDEKQPSKPRKFRPTPPEKEHFSYRKQDALFTPAERSFLGVLTLAVGDTARIFGKVRVADIIAPERGLDRSDWQTAHNKISAKHFDVILCDKKDLTVLCAIELDDKSHNRKDRRDRDEFLREACHSAEVPLIQIPARATYNLNDIRRLLAGFLRCT